MVTESFLVTALPRTADPDQQVHVSLFVSHRLTPDGAEGVLGDFAHVSDWTSELLGAEVALVGYVGGVAHPIPATPLLGVLETAVWPRVFPEKLTVRAWQTADPASLEWRSFPAHRMQQHALLAHAGALFSSPVDSPPVGGNALTGLLLGAIGLGQFERRLPLDLLLGDEVDIDEWATNFLDDVTGGGRHDPGGADDQPLIGLTADVHRARRYYQRPGADRSYRAEPVPGATRAPVVKPVPDFHERVGMIGDLSPLLRRLGLVIDLHVDDVDALAGVTEIAATVTVPGLANPVPAQPRTSCVVDGHGFWAASASGDHHRGMLRLGDEERYRVLDLDPDASALKLEQYVRTLPRMLATELNGDAVTSAPPGLRASGLAVARVDRSDHLQEQLADIPSRDLDLLAGKAPPQTIEALARGLRLEVWDDVSAQWHSLHRRRIDVEVDGAGMVLSDAADTGFLQGAALARAEDADGQSPDALYYAHEVLAGWEGWSLSVPRPGKVVVHQGGDEVVVDAPNPDPDPVNPVATTSRIEPLTLPWLRYGRSYSFRAWTVDLAGNSAPHHVAGPGGDDSPKVAPAPAATRGRRRERSPHDDGLDARLDDLADRAAHARITGLDPDATSSGAAALREQIRALHPVEQPGPRRG
ncbi:MAG: hypothetical protein KDB63_12255, partial [Nocardioidaceae bacterium]|nr:hypothetical protein [Nocardioidaceae bacterium]